ncbi:hypothetical protein [Neisseria animalis]|uniref:Uncharacterized protein n=1 Tax=Neisseria animalis TaxID=492 RepID=A0A5P3MP90_NEIAN|nr:hypothetical protein [Neisseria animalis]QEY23357.1 hypothetical protein D0T90_01610 [Neisseria animalis]ROW33205.1 hypothetical protein CGZ60_00345 [Neisseria animalis]VEE08753.1 Membrane protein [Neisseria animalis]
MNPSHSLLVRWLIVCLIPLATLLFFHLFPPHNDPTQYLINGIIFACEATFLFKFVLFEVIKHHLKQEPELKRKTAWLFAPIVLLIVYLFHYFGAF